ncbi:MAG: hypothetical protein EP323_07600 [Gammaproteobacteria bacterium]|nr:MAG: hypothetical protein EP323_07600 [Gammaproteobacteria bacterium]
MTRWYDFTDSGYEFPELGVLRAKWRKVPDEKARNVIAQTHQYYDFMRTMIIERLQSWSHPPGERKDWFKPTPLVLSARAGAVSNLVVSGVSIVECAMRSHAENRKIKKVIKKSPNYRTLGMLITSWENSPEFRSEIEPLLDQLKRVHAHRNGIHLYACFERDWSDVVADEMVIVGELDGLFKFFQELEPLE